MSINREFFFDFSRVQLFGGSLSQKQVEGMTAILDYWEAKHAANDKRWQIGRASCRERVLASV